MKHQLILAALLPLLLSADELIRNGDFRALTPAGLPQSWEIRAKGVDTVEVKDGTLTVKSAAPDGMVFLIQPDIPLKQGGSYLLRYQADAPEGASYRVYLESMLQQDGKRSSRSFGAAWQQGKGGDFRQQQEFFTFPAPWQKPYLVLNVKGDKPVHFRDLRLIDTGGETMFNSDFSVLSGGKPLNWSMRGKADQFRFAPNLATLMPKPGQGLWLVYNFTNHLPGMTYRITGEVRGSSGCKYRAYYEWMLRDDAGKLLKSASSGSAVHDVSAEWTKFERSITLPAAFSSATLALNAEGDGTVEFRNLMVAPAESADRVRSEAGGRWKFGKESRVVASDDGWSGVEVLPGNPSTLSGVPVKGGMRYKLDYQTLGIGDAASETGFHFYKLLLKFNNGAEIAVPADDVWKTSVQNKQFSFRTPDVADSLDIVCAVEPGGKVRLGTFRLTEQSARPEDNFRLTLTAPAYRHTIYGTASVPAITGAVDAPGAVVSSVTLTGESVKIDGTIRQNGIATEFSIPAQTLPEGTFTLIATVKDADGKSYRLTETVRKVATVTNEVTADGNGNFFCNGAPFFPIVLMAADAAPSDGSFYKIARSGFNTIRVGGTGNSLKRTLDLAQKYGLKLIVSFGHLGKDASEYRLWSHRVHETMPLIKDHPALFGYFLADEPAWTGMPAETVIAGHELLKSLDPYHPAWINAAPRGSLEEHRLFASGSDIYGLDIYPVPYPNTHSGMEDKSMTCVGKYTQEMRDSVHGRKGVWMMLQGFAWETMKEKRDPTKLIYPTPAESRFMAFDALTCGANAVGYWGTQYIEKPEFYRELFTLGEELHRLSGLFRNGKQTEVKTFGPVSVYTYQTSAGKAAVAINRSAGAQSSATAAFPPLEPWGVAVTGSLPPPTGTLPAFDAELEKHDIFTQLAIRRNSALSEPFPGGAQWIWAADSAEKPGSRVAAGLVVELDSVPTQAELQAVADDSCRMFVNGKECGSSDSWTFMARRNIAPLLRAGNNVIVIEGTDSGSLPCGILGKLLIDGKEHPSSRTWRAVTSPDSAQYTDPAAVKAWPASTELTPYGSGPWSRGVRMPKKIQ